MPKISRIRNQHCIFKLVNSLFKIDYVNFYLQSKNYHWKICKCFIWFQKSIYFQNLVNIFIKLTIETKTFGRWQVRVHANMNYLCNISIVETTIIILTKIWAVPISICKKLIFVELLGNLTVPTVTRQRWKWINIFWFGLFTDTRNFFTRYNFINNILNPSNACMRFLKVST